MRKYLAAFAVGASIVSAPLAVAQVVKREMIACLNEELLDEAGSYSAKYDTKGITQLLVSGQCTVLKIGEQVSVISRGFLTSTIRYRGTKLFTPSEAVR